MRFVPWSSFIDFVAPSARGAPHAAMFEAIRNAAIRLCAEARVWGADSEPADIRAGEDRYAFKFLGLPAQVVGVRSLRVSGNELPRLPRDKFPYGDGARGLPMFWREEAPGAILIRPVPDRNMAVAMLCVADLAPAHNADKCPEFIFQRHGAAVKWGALAELCNTASQAWSNPQMALADFEQKYRREVARARIHEAQGGAAGAVIHAAVRPFNSY